MEVKAEPPPPVEEEQVVLNNDEPAIRKRRGWKVPSPNTSRPLSPRFGEDAVMAALLDLRREHGLILEEILKRLPPARCDGGRLAGENLVELKPKDTASNGGSSSFLDKTAEQEHEVVEEQSQRKTPTDIINDTDSGVFHRRHGGRTPGISPFMHRLVTRPGFDLFFGFLILMNTIEMVVQEQLSGAQVGYELGWYTYYGSPEWTDIYYPEWWFDSSDMLFAFLFTIEVALKIAGMGGHFFRKPFEVFELLVVIVTDLDYIFKQFGNHNLNGVELVRPLRAVKLLRMLKYVRKFEGFDALHLMTTALRYSAWSLCWSVMLLLGIMTFFAMIATSVFRQLYLEDGSSDDATEEIFEYWGTFIRAFLSLFELALANWTPICRSLMENQYEGWMVAALAFKLVMGIAVVGVINAVFMQETFKVANTDDAIMVRTKKRAAKQFVVKMEALFKACDEDNTGTIQRDEFRAVLAHSSIQTWLASMDLAASDADTLFDLLRGDDDSIDHNELISGIGQLKGAARSIDMRKLLCTLRTEDSNVHPSQR